MTQLITSLIKPEETLILVVDDIPDNVQLIGQILAGEKYRIAVATNGKQAISIAEKSKPDLVLLDIMMPDMDGYEVCKRLKADSDLAEIPVIFLTGRSDTESVIEGFDVGGIDYIVKPFHDQEVLCRITNQLKLKKAQDEIIRREKFYRVIVESVPDLIFQLDPDRNIIFATNDLCGFGAHHLTFEHHIHHHQDSQIRSSHRMPKIHSQIHHLLLNQR